MIDFKAFVNTTNDTIEDYWGNDYEYDHTENLTASLSDGVQDEGMYGSMPDPCFVLSYCTIDYRSYDRVYLVPTNKFTNGLVTYSANPA